MTQETGVEISDEVVEVAARALARKFDPASTLDEQMNCDHWKRFKDEARTAIQAALPLLVEGLVPAESDNGSSLVRLGYNKCRNDILAKVKK